MWEDSAALVSFWEHWGFEPFREGDIEGVTRRVTFRKGALLGEVACYYSHDTVLWRHRGEATRERLLAETTPLRDVMTQRFLLVGDADEGKPRVRAFCFGFRGYVEVLQYCLGGRGHRKFRDLTDLVDAIPRFLEEGGRSERVVVADTCA